MFHNRAALLIILTPRNIERELVGTVVRQSGSGYFDLIIL